MYTVQNERASWDSGNLMDDIQLKRTPDNLMLDKRGQSESPLTKSRISGVRLSRTDIGEQYKPHEIPYALVSLNFLARVIIC